MLLHVSISPATVGWGDHAGHREGPHTIQTTGETKMTDDDIDTESTSRNVIVSEFLTLDGIAEAPEE